MATTIKNLSTGTVGSTAAAVYTAPPATTARATDANVVNASASDVTLTLWVPQGGAAGASNLVLLAMTIPGATAANGGRLDVQALRGRVVGAGGSIQAVSSVAGVLTLVIDGLEVT